MTIEARWSGKVIARSDRTVVVEGNHYFPREHVNADVLEDSATTSHCPWKGEAHYYSITVDGQTNTDAAWTYPEPFEKAANIQGRIAFWKGVEVSEA